MEIELKKYERLCPLCKGTGWKRYKNFYLDGENCYVCKGTGKIDWLTDIKFKKENIYWWKEMKEQE